MRLMVAAVGRMKDGPERELAARYARRAEEAGRRIGLRDVSMTELRESRAQDAPTRRAEEASALMRLAPERAVVVALDERGDNLGSAALAARLGRWRDDGRPAAMFVIGGDDGLDESLRQQATLRLAFGAATWPHQLVRIMLWEQIYRCVCILAGHPYHRA